MNYKLLSATGLALFSWNGLQCSSSSPETIKATAIASSIIERVKHTVTPYYKRLYKSIKERIKEGEQAEKKELRATQKKIQEECSKEKKGLQTACEEKKRSAYQAYVSARTEKQQNRRAVLATLATLSKNAQKTAGTLQEQFAQAESFLKELEAQAAAEQIADVTRGLSGEKAWLVNLEKTVARAGVATDQHLEISKKKKKGE